MTTQQLSGDLPITFCTTLQSHITNKGENRNWSCFIFSHSLSSFLSIASSEMDTYVMKNDLIPFTILVPNINSARNIYNNYYS